MSKISLEGNALGTGTFTITSPNSNTSRTLTLPDASGSVVITGGAQTIEFGAGTVSAPAITTTNDTNTGIYFPAADTIAFTEGGAEAMRIDSSGNVGIGVVPSAWYTGYTALNIGYSGAIWSNRTSSDTNVTMVGNNAYLNPGSTNWIYQNNGEATRYSQAAGQHGWFSAASGTAGNALTWTQVLEVAKDKSLALQGATPQSGTGITFPATQSASTNANTLDDYEEGSFTPNLRGSGTAGTVTYTERFARYTKIGRLVTVQIWVAWQDWTGSPTGGPTISNLPFTVNQSYSSATIYMDTAYTLAANSVIQGYLNLNSTNLFIAQYTTGGSNGNAPGFDVNSALMISASYVTDN
jgi:hypothetical protein